MGGAEVQRDALVIGVDVLEARIDLRNDLGHIVLGEGPALGGIVIFPQRVALKRFVREDAAKVRVSVEYDPEHIEHFPFVPVQPLEYGRAGGDRFAVGHADLETDALVVLQRVELVDDVETAGWSVVGYRLSVVLP